MTYKNDSGLPGSIFICVSSRLPASNAAHEAQVSPVGSNSAHSDNPWVRGDLRSQSDSNFSGGSAGTESACIAGDLGSILGLGRFPGEGDGLPTPVFWPG